MPSLRRESSKASLTFCSQKRYGLWRRIALSLLWVHDRGAAMEAHLGTWTCEALEEMATCCRAPGACPCEDRGAPAHTERRGQRLCRYEVVIDRGEVSGEGACSARPSAPGG